ncbi:galactose oxidase [bacterium]|nr:galactose oxidase [bacterium]
MTTRVPGLLAVSGEVGGHGAAGPSRRAVMACGAAMVIAGCSNPPTPATGSDGEISVGSSPASGGAGCWRARPRLPFAVQEIYPALHQGRIHIAGGFLADGGRIIGATARHIAYDPATRETQEGAPLPEARHHPHLVAHDGRLYALGGFASSADAPWRMTADTFVLDEAAGVWVRLADAPEVHGEVVAASLGGRIHVVGGRRPVGAANAQWTDQGDVDRHLVFDPAANSWSRAAPAPTARNSAAAVVFEGKLYVFGGRRVGGGNVKDTEIYDPASDRWSPGAPMPQGQGGLAAGMIGRSIYVFGGEALNAALDGSPPEGVYPQSWRYDPQADRWSEAASMMTPRHGLGAVSVDGGVYLVGGARRRGGAETSDAVEEFRLDCA